MHVILPDAQAHLESALTRDVLPIDAVPATEPLSPTAQTVAGILSRRMEEASSATFEG